MSLGRHGRMGPLTVTMDPVYRKPIVTVLRWKGLNTYTVGLDINIGLLLRVPIPDLPMTGPGIAILD
jgi:hypothetical protein